MHNLRGTVFKETVCELSERGKSLTLHNGRECGRWRDQCEKRIIRSLLGIINWNSLDTFQEVPVQT